MSDDEYISELEAEQEKIYREVDRVSNIGHPSETVREYIRSLMHRLDAIEELLLNYHHELTRKPEITAPSVPHIMIDHSPEILPREMKRGFRYESPFAEWDVPAYLYGTYNIEETHRIIEQNPHYQWSCFRNEYEKSGDQKHLDAMLSYVTLENPPPAPGPEIWMETEPTGDSFLKRTIELFLFAGQIGLVMAFVSLIALAIAGVI